MQNKNKPQSVTVSHSEQKITVKWADGHRSEYPLEGLRLNCPCVVCRGGHDEMGQGPDMSLFFKEPDRKWEIKNIEKIGNHAIRIEWDDGHNTGMYRWDRLRAMCPCEKCFTAKS